jgi:ribosomal-protein-alanine N-acetyltransferase
MTPEALAHLHARASDSPWSVDSFASQLADKSTFLTIEPNAFALGRATLDEAELLQIATDPDHQRKGHGHRVLAAFEIQAKFVGCTRSFLEVAQSNAAAIALYTSCGWVQDGKRPNYYMLANGQREDALLLSKSL